MITNLQTLRAFAAINVVFLHIIGTAINYDMPTQIFGILEGWGANGVDIFFVISGFVMLHTQMKNKRTMKEFYVSRLVRIVPPYWFVTTLVVAVFIVFPQVFRELDATPIWVASSYLFLSQILTSDSPIVFIGWTLEWEMLFYIVFGVSLLFNEWARSILFVFVVLTAIAVFSANPIIIEFFAGMLVAYIFNSTKISEAQGLFILFLGAVMLVASLNDGLKGLHLNRVIIWGIPSFLIVLGTVYSKPVSSQLLEYLGDASYSIYLVQMLTIPAFYKLLVVLSLDINYDLLSVLCLFFSIIVGSIMFTFVEKPTTIYFRNLSHRN